MIFSESSRFGYALLICLSLFCTTLPGEDTGDPSAFSINTLKKESDRQFINNTIRAFMRKYDIPGLSIAIARHGEMIFARGYRSNDEQFVADLDKMPWELINGVSNN